jgi:hypothetical protein
MTNQLTTKITESRRLAYIKEHIRYVSDTANAMKISFGKGWANEFPERAGVYAVFRGKLLIYVGESGSLRGRMRDLRRTQNHTLRRQLGAAQFANRAGYLPANSSARFPPAIEALLNTFMKKNLCVKFAVVDLGRKEIEEQLIHNYRPQFNLKTRRGDVLELVNA